MLDYISASADGSTMIEAVAVLMPALVLLWIVLTVTALHKRDAWFWSLGSTWASIIACPIALVIMSLSTWSQLHDPNVPVFHAPLIAGAILYIVAFGYAIFCDYNVTKSAMLAISTGFTATACRAGQPILPDGKPSQS
jgi:mannose/fructose/N-acetylgalactosamine-specific phosphotransferase system component IIC